MNRSPEDHARINRANDIYDACFLRLKALQAVAACKLELHGTDNDDEMRAALWWLVGEEIGAAIEAMEKLCELVRGEVRDEEA